MVSDKEIERLAQLMVNMFLAGKTPEEAVEAFPEEITMELVEIILDRASVLYNQMHTNEEELN